MVDVLTPILHQVGVIQLLLPSSHILELMVQVSEKPKHYFHVFEATTQIIWELGDFAFFKQECIFLLQL